jgi:hydroxyacylglutathione hydrolase
VSDLDVHRIDGDSHTTANCYLVAHSSGDAIVVDPGCGIEPIAAHVSARRLRVHAVVATHGHHDHVASAADVAATYKAPFHLHPADRRLLLRANFVRGVIGLDMIRIPRVDRDLDRATLRFGSLEIDVTHTPGHTPGGVCLAASGQLFSGDTVVAEGVGRSDLHSGDREALEWSAKLLGERYPPTKTVHPGHGPPAELGDILARISERPERG